MSKKLFVIILIITLCTIMQVKASASLNINKSTVEVGETFNVSVTLNGVAAWNIHVTATGPVTGCEIHQADASEDAMNTNKTFSATCTTTGEGTVVVNLSGDTSTENGTIEKLSSSHTITVIKKEVTPTPVIVPQPTIEQKQPQQEVTKSSNANIKNIKIEGFELFEIDETHYMVNIPSTTEVIKIDAELDDAKATITGLGEYHIVEGNNSIPLIVKAEDGTSKSYTINVNRKQKEKNIDKGEKIDQKKDTEDISEKMTRAEDNSLLMFIFGVLCGASLIIILVIIYTVISRKKISKSQDLII